MYKYKTHKKRTAEELKMLTVPVLAYVHQMISDFKCKKRNQSISACDSLTLHIESFQIAYILQQHNEIPEVQLWLLVWLSVLVCHPKTPIKNSWGRHCSHVCKVTVKPQTAACWFSLALKKQSQATCFPVSSLCATLS